MENLIMMWVNQSTALNNQAAELEKKAVLLRAEANGFRQCADSLQDFIKKSVNP